MNKNTLLALLVIVLAGSIVLRFNRDGVAVGAQTSHTAGDVTFHMRLAPDATFPTGFQDSDTATVHRSFWIAETEVTYELWYAVQRWASNNGYTFANAGREGSGGVIGQSPGERRSQPVTEISWYDSIVWANALSEMLAFDPVYRYQGEIIRDATDQTAGDGAHQEDADGFRLPTSDEWELAARYRGSDRSHGAVAHRRLYWTPGTYASGSTENVGSSSALEAVAWYGANSDGATHGVGEKAANALGLYDMSGNVWEWCFDWHPSYPESRRVYRGGGYNAAASMLQVGGVSWDRPFYVYDSHGFRLAMTAR